MRKTGCAGREKALVMGPNTWEFILRLALSALFGGIIGLEREIRLKGAGIRTHLIVCFASCMMMLVSKYGFFDMLEFASQNGYETLKLDPSRISAGLVTAIGFLGAGTIFARKRGVTGLSTAAGLWATVGIGMSTGAGMYPISLFGTVFLGVVQAALHRDHDVLGSASATILVQIEDRPEALDSLHAELSTLELEPRGVKYERSGGVLSVELQMDRFPCPDRKMEQILLPLLKQPYVKSVLW